MEKIEPHSDAFIADFFTREEQAMVAGVSTSDRPQLLTLLRSAKESALKALHIGLRLDTRCVIVSAIGAAPRGSPSAVDEDMWLPFQVRCTAGQSFQGWWQYAGDILRTLVADPPPAPPRRLWPTRVAVRATTGP